MSCLISFSSPVQQREISQRCPIYQIFITSSNFPENLLDTPSLTWLFSLSLCAFRMYLLTRRFIIFCHIDWKNIHGWDGRLLFFSSKERQKALLGNVLDPVLLPYFDPLCDSAAMRHTWYCTILLQSVLLITKICLLEIHFATANVLLC